MATAGFETTLYVGGTPTTMTTEATTEVAAGVTYQVTNTAKRVVDPATAISVADNGGAVAAGNYTLDYLTGTLTFSVAPTAPVTITGKYIPLLPIATARSASVSSEVAALDSTVFNTNGEPGNTPGLRKATASISDLDPAETDLDSGGGTTKLSTFISSRVPMFLKVGYGDGNAFYGWGFLEKRDKSSPAAELVSVELSWSASSREATGRSEVVCFTDVAPA